MEQSTLQEPTGEGQRISFPQIYAEHFHFVWALTRRLGVQHEALEDVVQEIFLVVHRKLHTLVGQEVLRDWLYGIVRRKVATHRRKDRSIQSASATALERLHTIEAPIDSDLIERSVDARQILSLVECIDPRKREVLLMAKVDELTCPQIAAALNIPVTTAYGRLRDGKAALAAVIDGSHVAAYCNSEGEEVNQVLRAGRQALRPSRRDKLRIRFALLERMRKLGNN